MKKLTTYAIFALVLILIILALMAFIQGWFTGGDRKTDAVEPVGSDVSDAGLTQYAEELLAFFRADDYAAIAEAVHPEYGVVFSPYATITLSTDRRFTPEQVAAFGSDREEYIWGVYDGSGDPIKMTAAKYLDDFVWDADYTKATSTGVDRIVMAGNALENISEVFPDARYIDFYVAADKNSGSADWHSLRLVFEEYRGKLMLSAVVHSKQSL